MRARFVAALAAMLLIPAGASADALPLTQVAQRTWNSMAAMVDTDSGLPADVLNANGSTSIQTSTTNVGAYMWSAVAAQRLGFTRVPGEGRPDDDLALHRDVAGDLVVEAGPMTRYLAARTAFFDRAVVGWRGSSVVLLAAIASVARTQGSPSVPKG